MNRLKLIEKLSQEAAEKIGTDKTDTLAIYLNYALIIGLEHRAKPVTRVNCLGVPVGTYASPEKAARETGTDVDDIENSINNNNELAGGYRWVQDASPYFVGE